MSVEMNHLKTFIKFAAKELGIKTMPNIRFTGHSEDGKAAFGHSIGKDITIRITDRHPIDVMRTIAHELIHFKQNLNRTSGEKIREDQANALAGRIMRKFDISHPEVFKDKPIKNIKEDGEGMTTSSLAANRMGGSSSTPGTGGIDTIDPLLKMKMFKRKTGSALDLLKPNSTKYFTNSPKKLRQIIGRDFKNDKRSDKR